MKVKPKTLTKLEKIKTLDALYTAASSLRGRNAMKEFLRDLLTESERIMLGRRILIAQMLLIGKTYDEIKTALGVGNETVHRVHRWLNDQIPGYEKAIRGIEKETSIRKRKYEQKKILARLKRNYPLHFLFLPTPKGFEGKK